MQSNIDEWEYRSDMVMQMSHQSNEGNTLYK